MLVALLVATILSLDDVACCSSLAMTSSLDDEDTDDFTGLSDDRSELDAVTDSTLVAVSCWLVTTVCSAILQECTIHSTLVVQIKL